MYRRVLPLRRLPALWERRRSVGVGMSGVDAGTSGGRARSWDDLPPQPWPEGTEAPAGELAGWLMSLSPEQLEWLLAEKRRDWSRDSECFVRNHVRQLQDARDQQDAVHRDLVAILGALEISDHARPYSSHDVVHREVLPAIQRLMKEQP